jgi:transketolase
MSSTPVTPKTELKMGMATREAYGQALVEVGKKNANVVALDADLMKSTFSVKFAKEFPDRFWTVGIAEANMVGIASGLAMCGKIPFASSFAVFLVDKGYDQLRVGAAYPHVNAKFVGSHSGISLGEDGPSQMSVEDIALTCALPGFVVLVPSDEVSTRALVHRMVEHVGPMYLRTSRPKAPIIYSEGEVFEIGKAMVHGEGKDCAIIACGLEVGFALRAQAELAESGIHVRVIDMHTLKPLDDAAIAKAALECGCIVTAEEHLLDGGLGARVASAVAKSKPVPMEFVGVRDTYAESATPDQLLEKYGLTTPYIVKAVKTVMQRK